LEEAAGISTDFKEVDADQLRDLKSINKRFFTKSQLDKLWIID